MNAETSVDHTTYYVRLLKDDLALGLDVLGDIISEPAARPRGAVAWSSTSSLQEIGAAQRRAGRLGVRALPAGGVSRPGDRPQRARHARIRSAPTRRTTLRRFLDTHYCGPQIVVAAAGNLDHAELVQAGGGAPAAPAGQPAGRTGKRAPIPAANRPRPRPVQRGADPARLRRPLLHRSRLRHRPSLLRDPRRRHGLAPLSGAARRARLVLFDLFLLLAVHGYRPVRHPDGHVGGRCRGAGAGRGERASQDDGRRDRSRA